MEILDAATFVALHGPLSYLVDGILLEGYLYSLTAKTGHGKTAVALELARCVMFEQPFGNRMVKRPGRVLYLIGENDIDTRMRYLAMSAHFEFDAETAPIDFIPRSFAIADELENIRRRADEIGGYALVVVDTSSAHFHGSDENSNTEMGDHARLQRQLCDLPGHPTVVTLCHPVKNPSPENLIPRGGGAFVAEVDGNLSLWKDQSNLLTLHWQGKFRGPDFSEMKFGLEIVKDDRNRSVDGDLIPTVLAVALTDADAERREQHQVRDEDCLLSVMATNPKASIAKLAEACGWIGNTGQPQKSKVNGLLNRLKKDGLVEQARKRTWGLTEKGKDEANEIASGS